MLENTNSRRERNSRRGGSNIRDTNQQDSRDINNSQRRQICWKTPIAEGNVTAEEAAATLETQTRDVNNIKNSGNRRIDSRTRDNLKNHSNRKDINNSGYVIKRRSTSNSKDLSNS